MIERARQEMCDQLQEQPLAMINLDTDQQQKGSGEGQAAPPPAMSKNRLRKQRRWEQRLAGRTERRKAEKARRKEKKKNQQKMEENGGENPNPRKKELKKHTMNESRCRLRVAVDMAYDELMDEMTVRKMMCQLGHCYAANRRAPDPLQFYIVGLEGKAKELFDERPGWQQWDAHVMHQPLQNLWSDEEIVYLTADSDNVLDELDEQKVYVIGGLLDHNHHKGLCLRRACERGLAHARLPIDQHVRMSTRKVLTINHVFEILVHFTRERDWQRAFLAVIPKRKGLEQIDHEEEAGREDADRSSQSVMVMDEEVEEVDEENEDDRPDEMNDEAEEVIGQQS